MTIQDMKLELIHHPVGNEKSIPLRKLKSVCQVVSQTIPERSYIEIILKRTITKMGRGANF